MSSLSSNGNMLLLLRRGSQSLTRHPPIQTGCRRASKRSLSNTVRRRNLPSPSRRNYEAASVSSNAMVLDGQWIPLQRFGHEQLGTFSDRSKLPASFGTPPLPPPSFLSSGSADTRHRVKDYAPAILQAENFKHQIETSSDLETDPSQKQAAEKSTGTSSASLIDKTFDTDADFSNTVALFRNAPIAGDIFEGTGAQRERRAQQNAAIKEKNKTTEESVQASVAAWSMTEQRKKAPWQVQKAAMERKLQGQHWNPAKRLSPDALEGIRAMHAQYPEHFTTPILAQHFGVSPEVIRRILKSKWRPSVQEEQQRQDRWERRGQRIWGHLAEHGIRPASKWRQAGIGAGPRSETQKAKAAERISKRTLADPGEAY